MTTTAALLIIDVQVKYIAEAANGDALVDIIAALRARAAAAGNLIVFIQHEEQGFGPGHPGWELTLRSRQASDPAPWTDRAQSKASSLWKIVVNPAFHTFKIFRLWSKARSGVIL
ncbi:isochorismatase family protein [Kibdelosporangium phytohabitans]|uniref:isochorismatase family protein n=1 Tax=Kibdelosporangium phytohabitans TaxID=860235 RepID=UPI0012FB43FC|nr:isochorismatase family protein [Kibdelosporangium phytohabitans]MBE1470743.1 nicotinamidase-related amidase [Kibdelosporangium phytohabitans]